VRIAAQRFPKRIAKGARQAFTLLEVLLASAIGVLLMAALYVAMDVQLRHAQAGRDLVEQSLLVRALLARMANDIRPSLGPALPPSSSSSSMPAAGGSSATAGAASTTAGASSNTSASTTSSTSATSSNNTPSIVLGVQGDSSQLILWVSRVPLDLNLAATSQSGQPISSDLRRISYWLAGGNSSLGLARQEVKLATSDDALVTMPPDIPDEASLVIAEEVKSLQFRYFDGTSWQDSWDATSAGPTGAPLGPPLAIEITLGVAFVSSEGLAPDATPSVKTYRHVVAIPTANGTTPPPTAGGNP
jgi:prepilin-type N-terminal cleavage/methylation domain-containing protein